MNWKGCINLKIECKSYEIYVNSIEQIQTNWFEWNWFLKSAIKINKMNLKTKWKSNFELDFDWEFLFMLIWRMTWFYFKQTV